MDKYFIEYATNKIHDLGLGYAQNHFAKKLQLLKDTPDKVIVDAADFNMKEALRQIEYYENEIKALKPKRSKK